MANKSQIISPIYLFIYLFIYSFIYLFIYLLWTKVLITSYTYCRAIQEWQLRIILFAIAK